MGAISAWSLIMSSVLNLKEKSEITSVPTENMSQTELKQAWN